MPNVKLPVPNSEYSISRNVIMSVVEDLKKFTQMGSELSVFFPNDQNAVPTKGSTIDDDNRRVPYLTKKALHIEVEEDTDPESMLNVHVNGTNNKAIINDKQVGFVVTPIYYKSLVTLTVKFRSDSRSEVVNWRNGLKTRLASGAQFGLLHTLYFNYGIPEQVYNIAAEIHELRERNYPTNTNFTEYFKGISSERLTSIHDTSGAFQNITVQESQGRVLGIWELTDIPEKPERDVETSTYTCNLVYKFTYMRPEYVYVRYPVSVFNELMPEKYVSEHGRARDYTAREHAANFNIADFHKFEMQRQVPRSDEAIGFARYPYFDDRKLLPTFIGYTAFSSFLVSIGEDKRLLLNLNELGDYSLQKDVLEFIRDIEYKYIGKPYQSMISVHLERNSNEIISFNDIQITKDLDIISNKDLDLRDEHRLVFSIVWDWSSLPRDAIDRALGYPEAFAWILTAVNRACMALVNVITAGVNRGDPFKRTYEPKDFDIAIAILVNRFNSGNYNGTDRISGYEFIGNRILDRVTQKLINELIRVAKQQKTVVAGSIIAYNAERDYS